MWPRCCGRRIISKTSLARCLDRNGAFAADVNCALTVDRWQIEGVLEEELKVLASSAITGRSSPFYQRRQGRHQFFLLPRHRAILFTVASHWSCYEAEAADYTDF
jgi:hypothetical protein